MGNDLKDDIKKSLDQNKIDMINHDLKKQIDKADKLDNLINDIPKNGKIPVDIKNEILKNCDELIKDLANDNDIDPKTVTRDELENKGIEKEKIDEILKLADIHNQVDSKKPVDKKKLTDDVKNVTENIK